VGLVIGLASRRRIVLAQEAQAALSKRSTLHQPR
jgi:hypothetical protein